MFYLVKSFGSGKRLSIVLRCNSSSKCAMNAGISQNLLSDIVCFGWAKESKIRECEKLKALSTGWEVLK